MEFIKPDINIDFVGRKRIALIGSAVFIGITILSILLHGGLRYGVDFAGGTLVQVKFSGPVTIGQIKDGLEEVDLKDAVVQRFGEASANEYLIRLKQSEGSLEGLTKQIEEELDKRFTAQGLSLEVRRSEMVGPKVGKELREKGVKSIVFAMFFLLIYITIRFHIKFALGAILALIHDVTITVGILSITNTEFTLPIVAALLTIVGYSINDTIVVYDRIREFMRRFRREGNESVVNRSINSTLSRTILTSVTTLVVVLALFILGGGVIHDFAFTLMIGILIGTYSSIFVASPVVIYWDQYASQRGRKR